MGVRMQESYIEGLTTHDDPESCAGDRKVARRSIDRGRCRLGIELRNQNSRAPTLLTEAEGNIEPGGMVSPAKALRSRRPHACIETPCTRTGRSSVCPPMLTRRDESGRPEAISR